MPFYFSPALIACSAPATLASILSEWHFKFIIHKTRLSNLAPRAAAVVWMWLKYYIVLRRLNTLAPPVTGLVLCCFLNKNSSSALSFLCHLNQVEPQNLQGFSLIDVLGTWNERALWIYVFIGRRLLSTLFSTLNPKGCSRTLKILYRTSSPTTKIQSPLNEIRHVFTSTHVDRTTNSTVYNWNCHRHFGKQNVISQM